MRGLCTSQNDQKERRNLKRKKEKKMQTSEREGKEKKLVCNALRQHNGVKEIKCAIQYASYGVHLKVTGIDLDKSRYQSLEYGGWGFAMAKKLLGAKNQG